MNLTHRAVFVNIFLKYVGQSLKKDSLIYSRKCTFQLKKQTNLLMAYPFCFEWFCPNSKYPLHDAHRPSFFAFRITPTFIKLFMAF